jgi:hypothetical protein
MRAHRRFCLGAVTVFDRGEDRTVLVVDAAQLQVVAKGDEPES